MLAQKVLEVADNGLALLQPIHVEDLARSFRLAVENNTDDYIHVKDGTTVIRLMDCIFRSANTSALVEV